MAPRLLRVLCLGTTAATAVRLDEDLADVARQPALAAVGEMVSTGQAGASSAYAAPAMAMTMQQPYGGYPGGMMPMNPPPPTEPTPEQEQAMQDRETIIQERRNAIEKVDAAETFAKRARQKANLAETRSETQVRRIREETDELEKEDSDRCQEQQREFADHAEERRRRQDEKATDVEGRNAQKVRSLEDQLQKTMDRNNHKLLSMRHDLDTLKAKNRVEEQRAIDSLDKKKRDMARTIDSDELDFTKAKKDAEDVVENATRKGKNRVRSAKQEAAQEMAVYERKKQTMVREREKVNDELKDKESEAQEFASQTQEEAQEQARLIETRIEYKRREQAKDVEKANLQLESQKNEDARKLDQARKVIEEKISAANDAMEAKIRHVQEEADAKVQKAQDETHKAERLSDQKVKQVMEAKDRDAAEAERKVTKIEHETNEAMSDADTGARETEQDAQKFREMRNVEREEAAVKCTGPVN